jgi:hypothetical protein
MQGTNYTATVEGNTLVIKVDLSVNNGLTGSGKNISIATTGGNVEIPGTHGVKMGLNIYKPATTPKTAKA